MMMRCVNLLSFLFLWMITLRRRIDGFLIITTLSRVNSPRSSSLLFPSILLLRPTNGSSSGTSIQLLLPRPGGGGGGGGVGSSCSVIPSTASFRNNNNNNKNNHWLQQWRQPKNVVVVWSAQNSNNNNFPPPSNRSSSYVLKDSVLKEAVQTLQRASWLSWWSQMILTVISTVILGFAQTSHAKDAPNLVLSGTALMISALSIVWTWGNGSRLSRRLYTKPASRGAAANMLRRAVRVGTILNLVGLLCNVLAAQEIIGGLALKVLTQRQTLLDGGLQPLDVLVVQANANSLLSHYISLVCLLYLTNPIARLDPPSRDGVDDI